MKTWVGFLDFRRLTRIRPVTLSDYKSVTASWLHGQKDSGASTRYPALISWRRSLVPGSAPIPGPVVPVLVGVEQLACVAGTRRLPETNPCTAVDDSARLGAASACRGMPVGGQTWADGSADVSRIAVEDQFPPERAFVEGEAAVISLPLVRRLSVLCVPNREMSQ